MYVILYFDLMITGNVNKLKRVTFVHIQQSCTFKIALSFLHVMLRTEGINLNHSL